MYGFAGGDPVNYADPFGLKIIPLYDPWWSGEIASFIKGSPTFARIWRELALAPARQARIAVMAATPEEILKASGGRNSEGWTECFLGQCKVWFVSTSGAEKAMDVLKHELLHASAQVDADLANAAGVPGGCGYDGPVYSASGCFSIEDRMMAEINAAREKRWEEQKKAKQDKRKERP